MLSSYTSGTADGDAGFDITINFIGANWTVTNQQAFIDASDYLSELIIGDLSAISTEIDGRVFDVDDLEIDAELLSIDGIGGILGSAGPRYLRNPTGVDEDFLPFFGEMEFDIAEFDTGGLFNDLALYSDTILHEMLHVLGLGPLWDLKGLITGAGTSDPRYTGVNALFEYEKLYPTEFANDPNAAAGVPLEDDGGAGTADAHWEESIFGNELMTGFISSTGNTFSNMSIAALEDLGYSTTYVATCFAAGTCIATPRGWVAVEDLVVGDSVVTRDNGVQPLLYITDSVAERAWMVARPELRPIRLRLGGAREVVLSRQHRVLVAGRIAQRMFGVDEVLIPAKDFVPSGLGEVLLPDGPQRYLNLLFSRHEIVAANGLWCESLYFGAEAQKTLSDLDRAAAQALIRSGQATGEEEAVCTARPLHRGPKAQRLLARAFKNDHAVLPD